MAHDHETHRHGAHGTQAAERALWLAFGLNAVFLAVELVVGLMANSLALLSDAGHMVSDVAALGLALIAQRLARARSGPGFTFGLRRVPVLGAFGNALSLLVISALILWDAWHRLQQPPEVAAVPVLVVGLLGLLVNGLSAGALHRSGGESLNIRGAMLHLLADAIGSLGAIVAAVVLLSTGWEAIDAVVSAAIALLILLSAWPLLRDSTKVLLQSAPRHCDPEAIEQVLVTHPLVSCVADLHVWQIDVGQVVLSAVLVTDEGSLAELEVASRQLKQELQQTFRIEHTTIEWSTSASSMACTIGRSLDP